MSLNIIERVQDFGKYYMKHCEVFDGDPTHTLNKKHKIDG